MKASLVAAGAVLTLLLAVALPARAEPSASELALARQLFAEAGKLEEEGQWALASEKLREALSIKETPGLRYHLAHCEEQAGALVSASLEYARASELIREGAQAPDVAQLLTLADQRLATRIPKLTLRVPPGVDGVAIEIDGRAFSDAARKNPVPLDPGSHGIVARARNRPDFSATVTLKPGESLILDLAFGPERKPPAALPVAPVRIRSRSAEVERKGIAPRTVALLGEGVLVASGLAVGIGFGVQRSRAAHRIGVLQRDVDAQTQLLSAGPCNLPSRAPACDDLKAAIDDHQRASVLMTVGFVGAGVGTAAGVLTWLLWPSAEPKVTASAGPDGLMLSTGGSF